MVVMITNELDWPELKPGLDHTQTPGFWGI